MPNDIWDGDPQPLDVSQPITQPTTPAYDPYDPYKYQKLSDPNYQSDVWDGSTSQKLFRTNDNVGRKLLGLDENPHQKSEVLPDSHFGILGDIGSSIASGVLRTGEMALRDLRALDPEGGGDAVRDWTTKGIERIKQWEEEYPKIFKPSKAAQGGFRRWITEGLSGTVQSAAAGLPGMLVGGAIGGAAIGGPLGAILGGALGFGLSAGSLYGVAEYDQFMEEAEAQGIPREHALPYAISSGAVEGFGEFLADATVGLILPPGSATVFKGTIKSLLKPAVSQVVKSTLLRMPAEVITEMAQNASQVALRNAAGLPKGDPWQAALESIGPAMVMTILFGAGFHGKNAYQLRRIRKNLTDGNIDPDKRRSAAKYVYDNVKSKDPNLAELWRFNSDQYIDAGYGIPIDRKTSEFLAWGEFNDWSPKFAQDLADGKEIKLLPPGQGFVMTGEAYDPDDTDGYDQYSPEFASKLKKDLETKYLPPGVDFTLQGKTYTNYSPYLREMVAKEGETPKLPAGQTFEHETEYDPIEAAARGVEAAVEVGRPEDIKQAQRTLEARVKEQQKPLQRTPALVRQELKRKPESTIGEIYRAVKSKDRNISRQEVARLVKKERGYIPKSQKELRSELDKLGKAEFQDTYNPTKVQGRLARNYEAEGMSKLDAAKRARKELESYAKLYEKTLATPEITPEGMPEYTVVEPEKTESPAKAVKKAPESTQAKKQPQAKKGVVSPKPAKKTTAQPQKKTEKKPKPKLQAKPKAKKSFYKGKDFPTGTRVVWDGDEGTVVEPVKQDIDAKVQRYIKMDDDGELYAAPVGELKLTGKEAKELISKEKKESRSQKEPVQEKRPEEIVEQKPPKRGDIVDLPDNNKGRLVQKTSKKKDEKRWMVQIIEGPDKGDTLPYHEGEFKKTKGGDTSIKARLGKVVSRSYNEGVGKAGEKDNILVTRGEKQGSVLLAQIRSREKPQTQEEAVFDRIYTFRKQDGYMRPADFWEVPMWIGEAANTFEDSDLFVIRDIDKAIGELNKAGYPTVMFSVLDANKEKVRKIAENYNGKIIVGGYIDEGYFKGLDNVTFHKDIASAAKELGVPYRAGVDYVHFKDTETIPRLCLSKGCKHKCAFCVVPKTIITSPREYVRSQLDAFRNLKFKLVYLDDKTFGQAENYRQLVTVYQEIKRFNPEFEGFVIQTTAPQLLKMSNEFLEAAHIKNVELGVESYNDDILGKINKPHRVKQLDQAVIKLRRNGINFIPNIIVGLAGKGWSETRESYNNTIQFLYKNMDIISHINVYNLALYEGTELHEQLETKIDTDYDENSVTKSFHVDKDIHEEAYKEILRVMSDALEADPQTPVFIKRFMKQKGLTFIDPNLDAHRTYIPGAELRRLKDDPDAPNRVHYYPQGGFVEPQVGQLPYEYVAEVKAGRFYDLEKDPLKLRVNARRPGMVVMDWNLAEKMMKDAGYIGYHGNRGDKLIITVIFDKLPVKLVREKGEYVGHKESKARSSESLRKEIQARKQAAYVELARRAFPTATEISPAKFLPGDVFFVKLPNGAKIEVRINELPEDVSVEQFAESYDRDISNERLLGLWVPSANVTITGEGIIYLSGWGDLQTDIDHESFHAAVSIVLTKAEMDQLDKDYWHPEKKKREEKQAKAYEVWRKSQRTDKLFEKIKIFFQRIAEAFGIGDKAKSHKIFRQISTGKVWARDFKGRSNHGRLGNAIYSLLDENPRFKKEGGTLRYFDRDTEEWVEVSTVDEATPTNDLSHWYNVGAVLYIEGLKGKEWTAEMTAQIKESYGIDKIERGVLAKIREGARGTFQKRASETLAGRLPVLAELMEVEKRGVAEGGMVWYDVADGLSALVETESGDIVANSAKRELYEFFGQDAEFMAGLIAHLSSGMPVDRNIDKAIEVYIASKIDLPFKGTHQVTEEQIREFLETKETSGPKRLPFFHALMGDADAIVIDRWMARVMGFKTMHPKKKIWVSSTGATDAQRALLIEWIKRGAKRMGITNRAYQALLWAGQKALDEEASGYPTGTMDAVYKVLRDKIERFSTRVEDIPKGKEDDYFILPDQVHAIKMSEVVPLKDPLLIETKKKLPPKDIRAAREKAPKPKPLTPEEAGQPAMFARFGNPETAVEDTLDDVFGAKHKGILTKLKEGWKNFTLRTQLLDEFHPIQKHLGKRAYVLHRMLNGVHASVEALMRHGKLRLNPDGSMGVDGLENGFAVWAKKHGKDAVNVLRWAAAQRAERLEETHPEFAKNEEFLTLAKRERIYQEIGEAPEGGGTWESLHAEFQEYHDSVLDIAEKAGVIDAATREQWGSVVYVPFYRVFEDPESREEYLRHPNKAVEIANKLKPIKGSKRKIGEPIENVVANWGYLIQESMRNQARREAYVAAQSANELIDLVRDIDYQEVTGITVEDGVISYNTKKGDEHVLSFLDNGVRKYFKVNNIELYNALTTMNAKHFGKMFNAFFGVPKRLLTRGATFGPAFRVANAVRDTLHTWMITPGFTFKPFIDTAKGFLSAMREDEAAVAALAAGALHGGSYVHAEDPASMSKFTQRLLRKEENSVLIDGPAKLWELWEKIGAASENAARIQLYKTLKDKGASDLEAAYEARDLLDFALKGQARPVLALIRMIPFLGARTQGNYRLARAALEPGNRLMFAMKGAILASASLALWAMFADDDRYKELEDYDKWSYYHFWIGDQHFRMPKPFEVGAIFSSMFESFANTLSGNDDVEFLKRFFYYTFTQTFAIDALPQTIKPMVEVWANKSSFTGRPIEGESMKLLKPGERAEPWTSETLRMLGRGLNLSPKKMEHLARGYLATFSAFFLGGTDQVARWMGDFPERPTYRSDDFPLVGRFWRQGPARNTKYATRLYEAMDESDKLVQTVKHYMILGDLERATKMAEADIGKYSLNKYLNRIRKKLTTLRTAMKDVERNPNLTREEKRIEIDDLTKLRNELLKDAYDTYMENIK